MRGYDASNIFAKIFRGEIPSYRVLEAPGALAILDAFPAAPGHTLLLPRGEYSSILDCTPASAGSMLGHLPGVARAVKAATGADGVSVLANCGSAAGQEVFHCHFHIVPRVAGDELVWLKPGAPSDDPEAEARTLQTMQEMLVPFTPYSEEELAMAAAPVAAPPSSYDADNVFAKILSGDIPSKKVFETAHALAILDAFPMAPGHALLLPKALGYTDVTDMPKDQAALVLRELPRLCAAVAAATGADGVNVAQNNGAAAGQVVMHPHFHVIPRFAGDKLVRPAAGSEMISPEAGAEMLAKVTGAL